MTTITIHYLSPRVTIQDLIFLFEEAGELLGVYLVDGTAHITFKTHSEAMMAIYMYDGEALRGKILKLHISPRKQY